MPRTGCRQRNSASQPVTSIAAQIDQRLIVQFEGALRQRRAQIRLQFAAKIGLLLHRGIEEAIGPAAGRLRRIHREIGVLQEIEQIGAVARRDRDADAGIAGKLVAVAVERGAQRLIDPRDQRVNVLGALDAVLKDGEFVPAEAGDEIFRSDRLAQPLRHALQELVADQMSQRIVDALELVDVDVEDRELASLGFQQQPFRMALEQRAVRQIGQRVVMGEMLDPGLVAPPFGDVFQRRGPAAVRRALEDQPDRAPVRRRGHGVLNQAAVGIEKPGAIGVDVADKGAALLAVPDQVAQMAAGFDHVGREAEHVDILPVADHQAPRGIEQQQALRHVVDGGVEMLALLRELALRGGMLAAQLAHDQEDHADHDDDRQRRRKELQPGLRAPVGERGLRPCGRDDQDRKMHQRLDRADLVFATTARW